MKRKLHIYLMIISLVFLLPAGWLQAQEKSVLVTGMVVDNQGAPLQGANVQVKGTGVGAVTDSEGKYSIRVPEGDHVMLFSFVGYQPLEEKIGKGQQRMNVTLEADKSGLNEVVVIGYGTAKRKDLTGSVGSVDMTDVSKAPVKSIDDALAGRISGVQVVATDGQPGGSANIKIRGANSINGDNTPLYVIDGFPVENFDLNSISMSDIESLDVLKDASATAIYGARGANGVVIITTKRGKVGAPRVEYNGYVGIQRDLNRIEVLSPYEFVKLQLEISPGLYGKAYTTDVGKTLEDYRNIKGIDWYDKVFRKGIQQNHTLSIQGGSDKTKYSLTGSVFDQKGIIINTGYTRYQGRFTIDQTLNSRLKVGLTANLSSTKTYGMQANANGGYASFMPNLWGYRPIQVDSTIDITTELQDPEIGNAPPRTNPFLQAQNELRQVNGMPFFANGYLDYNITKELKLRITGGVSTTSNENQQFNNSKTRAGANIVGSVMGINGSQNNSRTTSLTNENTLSYNKSWKNNRLSLTGGFTQQTYKRSSFGATSIYVPNESLGVSGLDEGIPYNISASSGAWVLHSFLARANYSFRSKYLFTASVRADGSSKFPAKSRWGYFPSGAIAWRISEEKFMKGLTFIDDAKLRASYGTTGNNRVTEYAYYPSLAFLNNDYSFGNQVPTQGAVASSLGNPDLRWESTAQYNVGLDLSVLKGALNVTAEYYNKVTNDLLLRAALPVSTGYTEAYKNIGKVSNSGIELTLNSTNIDHKNFKWNSSFNISFNRNKVLELTENQESILSGVSSSAQPYYIAKKGYPIAMFYGLIYDGVYQYDDFYRTASGGYRLKDEIPSNSTAALRANVKPGDIRFRDINKDGIINTSDYTIIGDPNPDFIGGFTNNFQYAGFDLNIFMQFVYGSQILNNNILTFVNGSVANTNQFAQFANRWSPTNTNTNIPRAGGATTNYNYSRAIQDGSYLKFKTASLGYSLPPAMLNRLKVRALRVYFSAQNIITFTKYEGSDPDVSVRDTPLTPAFDYSSYPSSRVFVAGVSVTF